MSYFIYLCTLIYFFMRKISILIFAIILSLVTVPKLFAIPASPYPVKITQPDGSEITVQLLGDEFFNYKTTTDGYLLVRDKQGFLNYGTLESDGTIKNSGFRAKELNKRTAREKKFLNNIPQNTEIRKTASAVRASRIAAVKNASTVQNAYPLTGSPKSLVILVNFSDKSFVTANPQAAFHNLLNQEGYSANGGTGSARDYFSDASNGAFAPVFDVVGPYTLKNNMAFYGENLSGGDKNPRQMIIDACALADANGVDFSQYDTDGDGFIDNIFVYYAGNNEAEGGPDNTIWPHRWALSNTNTKFDDKIVYDYACTSELRSNSGSSMCGIGTFCHEFGHVLGLPDYYATDNATHHTLLSWNIMDSGAYLNAGRTPPTYSAYDRFYLNWLIPIELKTPQLVTIEPLNKSNKAYIITQNGNHNLNGAHPSPTEFFTLENRQQTGWDSYLPGHGLLITRINYSENSWYSNTPNNNPNAMGVDIIEADGLTSKTNLAGDAFPGTNNVRSYNPTLRYGTVINKPITFIKEENGTINFRFMGGGKVPTFEILNNPGLFNTVQGTPSQLQTIKVVGKLLEDSIRIAFANNVHFEMKTSTEPENKWRKYVALAAIDSIVDTSYVQIRYNPTYPSFSDTHNETIILSSKNKENIKTLIYGKSSRPVYVVPPVANEALDVTLGSYVANWNDVYDASGYYLTAYSVSDGTSTRKQGFKNGLTAPNDWKISAEAISSSANYSGDSVPAIQFRYTGDYIQTEEYYLPVSELSFFAKSMAENNGNLALEAWNGTKWNIVNNVAVTSGLAGTNTFNFSTEDNYTRFRITFTKNTGYVVVDDVNATYPKKVDYIITNKWLQATSDTITNLISNRYHYYKVKASDRTFENTNLIKYENITDFSNIVEVKTLEDKDISSLRTLVQKDGSVKVILADTDNSIIVFNALGQKITEIVPDANIVTVNGLIRNKVYIFKSGKRRSKVIL